MDCSEKSKLPFMVPFPENPNYLVTKDGRIYSTFTKKFMKPKLSGGYMKVSLAGQNKSRCVCNHRMVAITYIPNPNNLPFVNHCDGNKINNHVDNLAWISHLDNMRHAVKTGLNKGRCRAVYQKDIKTKEIIARFNSIKEAEKKMGFSDRCIGSACGRENGTSHGYIWEYVIPEGKKVKPRKLRKKPVIRIDLKTKEEVQYTGVEEAAEANGISGSYLSMILHDKRHIKHSNKDVEKYEWKFVKVDKTSPFEKLYEETRTWEKIHGCPNYRVSKDGRIFSDIKNILLKPILNRDGYLRCILCQKKDDKTIQKSMTIHKAIVEAYIRFLKDKEVINHLNGNKTDNRLENLKITTQSENVLHALDTGLNPIRKPVLQLSLENIPIAKYSSVKIAAEKCNLSQDCKKHKISVDCIRASIYLKGTTGGYKWIYLCDYKEGMDRFPFYDIKDIPFIE